MLWHSAANCKVSKFSHFFAFFWRTTGLILIKLWFLFMLWHSAATCTRFHKFSQFLAFFPQNYWWLILINLLFLFMLCHSAANCKVSKFSSLFCIFLKNYWSSSNIDFCSCCCILQPVAKFHNFLSFLHCSIGTTGLILIKSFIFVYAVPLCSQL